MGLNKVIGESALQIICDVKFTIESISFAKVHWARTKQGLSTRTTISLPDVALKKDDWSISFACRL